MTKPQFALLRAIVFETATKLQSWEAPGFGQELPTNVEDWQDMGDELNRAAALCHVEAERLDK